MSKTLLLFALTSAVIKIESMENIGDGRSMEVCGSVTSAKKFPVAVTLNHEGAEYTTMSSPKGNWCVVVKRWSMAGQVKVSGVEL
jgi:hypothetical protein